MLSCRRVVILAAVALAGLVHGATLRDVHAESCATRVESMTLRRVSVEFLDSAQDGNLEAEEDRWAEQTGLTWQGAEPQTLRFFGIRGYDLGELDLVREEEQG